jgi:hypothetical protein
MLIVMLLLNLYVKWVDMNISCFCAKLMMIEVVVVKLLMNSCSNVIVVMLLLN